MLFAGLGLSDTQSQAKLSVESGVGQKNQSAGVELIHDGLIQGIHLFLLEGLSLYRMKPKAKSVQRNRCHQLKVVIRLDP